MPDEQPILDPAARFDQNERDILYLLTGQVSDEPIWSVDDLAREVDGDDVMAYVEGLHRAGLIHKTSDGFVFASRPAFRFVEIVGHVL